MKSFSCQHCHQSIFFENHTCTRCESVLAFIFDEEKMSAFHPQGDYLVSALNNKRYRHCQNKIDHDACNWVVEYESEHKFCLSCRLNRTIPNLSVGDNQRYWEILESGKRRLLYSLMRLGLPIIPKTENEDQGLAFEFLKDTFERIQANDYVMTGHVDGVITLNIAEADDVERERRRHNLNEDYRTVLGHFRHESGHYYWQQLVWNQPTLTEFRELFGNEQTDYKSAVNQHYDSGAPDNWQSDYVSAYASCHPWEDFAETWGHYLMIADTLETANEYFDSGSVSDDFDDMLERWLPLTMAVNNINRSGGQPDLYPFVLSSEVVEKLTYVHNLIQSSADACSTLTFK